MKRVWKRLQLQPRLTGHDLWLTLVPILTWATLIMLRPRIIEPRCQIAPDSCTRESIWPWEQHAIDATSSTADTLSFVTQNSMAVVALLTPALFLLVQNLSRKLSRSQAIQAWGTDWLILLQTTFWNGAFLEMMRLLSQRPRPFVYSSPFDLGSNPAHYTSFYSGHTSFVAAIGSAVVLILIGRKAPRPWLWIFSTFWLLMVAGTATFRVMAGRHFPTDVIAGAVAGLLVALGIALAHRPRASR